MKGSKSSLEAMMASRCCPPGGPWLLFDGVETAELPLGMENQRGTQ